jgi:hypothetical protein
MSLKLFTVGFLSFSLVAYGCSSSHSDAKKAAQPTDPENNNGNEDSDGNGSSGASGGTSGSSGTSGASGMSSGSSGMSSGSSGMASGSSGMSSGSSGMMMDAGTREAGTPAPPGTFPVAVNQGGPVIKNPKIQVITFTGDTLASQIEDFAAKMPHSTYWNTLATEYGINNISNKTPIRLTDTAPTTTSFREIGTWLANKISANPSQFGTPDGETVYAIYYPATTKIQDTDLGNSCETYLGFHYETKVGTQKVGFAVMPRCTIPMQPVIDTVTETSSHEFFEWATDPFPQTSPSWSGVDDDHAVWQMLFLGELGDLCARPDVRSIKPTDLGYLVQRQWSNIQSKAGHHPCVPGNSDPYFQAIPTMPDTITYQGQDGANHHTKGLQLAVGASKTLDVLIYSDYLFSDDITLDALDIASAFRSQPQEFDLSFDKTTVHVGDTVKLTVTAKIAATQGYGFVIVSRVGRTMVNIWPGLVVTDM